MATVTRITQKIGSKGTWEVYINNGDFSSFVVYAQDELGAFQTAKKMVEKKEMNERVFMLCATAGLLALVGALTYNCSAERSLKGAMYTACIGRGQPALVEGNDVSCSYVRKKDAA